MKSPTYWNLSAFYFFFFASMGTFIPYWSLYLQEEGFSPGRIGVLMSVIMGTKIVAPNVWGWIADRSGRRVFIIRLGTLLSLLLFAAVALSPGYWWLAVSLASFAFFWNAVLPQFEATTLTSLGKNTHLYSRIRLWGSVGFIIAVSGFGSLFDRYDIAILPWVMLAMLGGLFLNALVVPEGGEEHTTSRQDGSSLGSFLRNPVVPALLVACFLIQASHGPYYTFFTIYLEEYGYSRSAAGQLWALGVVAEVGVFLVIHRWLARFGSWRLLLAAFLLTVIRWLMIAVLVNTVAFLVLAQVLHAASFGVYHAAAIQLIFYYFPGQIKGRGQALFASLSFGLGGAVGSAASGYVWTALGGPWAFGMGALLAAAGFIAVWYGGWQARVGHFAPKAAESP